MRHDPERIAVAYLNGDLRRATRRAFEEHLLECDDCWREVVRGRRGRVIAESARELAPHHLRESVRARVELLPVARHRRRWVWIPAAAAVVIGSVVLVVEDLRKPLPGHDLVIAAAVTATKEPLATTNRVRPDLPDRVGRLQLVASYAAELRGIPAVVHSYENPTGQTARVYQGRRLPMAQGHRGPDWLLTRHSGDTVVLCAAEPVASIIVGDDFRQVHRLARVVEIN